MSKTNYQIARDFERGIKSRNKSMKSTGDKLYSYWTVIKQRLPDGRTVGNVTKYSSTTSNHQRLAGVNSADIIVRDVPRGTDDLKDIRR